MKKSVRPPSAALNSTQKINKVQSHLTFGSHTKPPAILRPASSTEKKNDHMPKLYEEYVPSRHVLIKGEPETPPARVQHCAVHRESVNGSDMSMRQTRGTAQLEHALREETIANEEQRNYISILKNMIESKMEREGILGLLQEARQRDYQTFGNQDNIQVYLSLTDLKAKLDYQSHQIAQLAS
jgi:hypothetical protein